MRNEDVLHQQLYDVVGELKELTAAVALFADGDPFGDVVLKEAFRGACETIKKYDSDFLLPSEMNRLKRKQQEPA